MKIYKRNIFWIALIILGLWFYLTREEKITHVVLNDGVSRVRIPEEIVKSKDCEKYHEWFYARANPLAVWNDRCPWSKPPKGEIGEFIVGVILSRICGEVVKQLCSSNIAQN
ncbi:hypothetical protein H1Q59_08550 [Holosporaceae bacterium 'Namur']|nr:hypothetical protein [Holosporaceae bacterium 'Namur']